MNRSKRLPDVVASLALVIGLAACSQQAPESDKAAAGSDVAAPSPIAARQAEFKRIGAANKAIGDQLKQSAPSAEIVRTNAAIIARLAPQVPSWFPAGSGAVAGEETEALPAIWERNEEFTLRAADFARAADALEAAASAGDSAQIRAASEALGQTCKSCHTVFRAKK